MRSGETLVALAQRANMRPEGRRRAACSRGGAYQGQLEVTGQTQLAVDAQIQRGASLRRVDYFEVALRSRAGRRWFKDTRRHSLGNGAKEREVTRA